jgi:hypothetical protein
MLPAVKMIFLLRDPASRTYSHYWHLVRSGRAVLGFDDSLRRQPSTLVQRSLYLPQVERYLDAFPTEQLCFIAFEELVREPMATLRRVTAFLGLPEPDDVPSAARHRNQAQIPRSVRLQLAMNRLVGRRGASPRPSSSTASRQHESLRTATGGSAPRSRSGMGSALRRAWFTSDRPAPMDPATRRFLNELFRRENAGLDELVGSDISAAWYTDG